MTDTPTPERGEFSDLLDTLCSTWHQKEETDYDHMRGSCSTLDAARADFAYREARRLVVKHVDALRRECARKDAKIARLRGALKDLYERMDCSDCRTSPDFLYCDDCEAIREQAMAALEITTINPGAPRDGE